MMEDKEYFMRKALLLAQKAYDEGEVPVGAVVVHNGEIIGEGYNQRTQKQNALLHAETVAIYNTYKKMDSDFQQIFIDDLNGKNLLITDLFEKEIENLFKELINVNSIFKSSLYFYINKSY